jgi:hypothetical protein
MKKLWLLGIMLLSTISILCLAKDVYVDGYTRKDGTYVQPYHRSSPNNTVRDNYSYEGNTNPYTGEEGHNYYRNNPTSEYYQPQQSSYNYNTTNNYQNNQPSIYRGQTQAIYSNAQAGETSGFNSRGDSDNISSDDRQQDPDANDDNNQENDE